VPEPLPHPGHASKTGSVVYCARDRATLIESADLVEQALQINTERFCLAHGDYRLDNLLFDPDETSLIVVWRSITVGLPARHRAFLGTGMDADRDHDTCSPTPSSCAAPRRAPAEPDRASCKG
jgi:hypothetical protein